MTNTIKKLHILFNLHHVYQQNFYHDQQYIIDEIFDEYHITLLKYMYYPALNQEWKQNPGYTGYEKN